MKLRTWFSLPVLAVAGAFVASACSSPASSASTTSGGAAPAPAAAPAAPAWVEKIKQGALVLDVRTQEEWDTGHFESARLVPIADFGAHIGEIEGWLGGDKTKPVVVYCKSGRRAAAARELLLRAGFTNVDNAGGFDDVSAEMKRAAGAG